MALNAETLFLISKKVYDNSMFRKSFYLSFLFSCTVSCASQTYYCSYPQTSISAFDKIIELQNEAPKRIVYTNYFGDHKFIKSYDEENRIISVYEELNFREYNDGQSYLLLIMDFSSHSPLFRYGYGSHQSDESFQKAYSGQPLSTLNRSPEFIEYLPSKENPNYISLSFLRSEKYECEGPLNIFEQTLKKTLYVIISFMSG